MQWILQADLLRLRAAVLQLWHACEKLQDLATLLAALNRTVWSTGYRSGGISCRPFRSSLPIRLELLYFPNENHWVLSHRNSIVWHDRVLGWLARWLGGEGGGGEGVAKLWSWTTT